MYNLSDDKMRTTISLIKADIGSLPGHVVVYEDLMDAADDLLAQALDEGKILDYYTFNAGDDTELLMTHDHEFFWVLLGT